MIGDNRIATTYEAAAISCERALEAAASIMSQAGVTNPTIDAYTVWRVSFNLTPPMLDSSDLGFHHVTAAGANLGRQIRELPSVFEASFEQPGFDTINVDVRGETAPSTKLMESILALVHDAEAQQFSTYKL